MTRGPPITKTPTSLYRRPNAAVQLVKTRKPIPVLNWARARASLTGLIVTLRNASSELIQARRASEWVTSCGYPLACGYTLACASWSTSQKTDIVTHSQMPIISATALLELVRWCEHRFMVMEDSTCEPSSPPAYTERPENPSRRKSASLGEPSQLRPARGRARVDCNGGQFAPPAKQGG